MADTLTGLPVTPDTSKDRLETLNFRMIPGKLTTLTGLTEGEGPLTPTDQEVA